MSQNEPLRVTALRAVITDFLAARYKDKLEAVKEDVNDPDAANLKRETLRQRFTASNWLGNAASRIKGIQLVTHVLKATHPSPKIYEATSLYVRPETLTEQNVVGSHVLNTDFRDDVTGDAAVLDVYDLLTRKYQGLTILELARSNDPDLSAALCDDPGLAASWMLSFANIEVPRCIHPTSHTLAKQLYWQIGDDVQADASYHLLSPLYASSLAHRVYETLQDDRFSEAAKAARDARKAITFSERPVHEYPQMAVQQLGGTKPQNISQLNSERRGNNCLLASLPPVWRSMDLKPLLNTDSMFHRYSRRPEVRQAVKDLLAFLKTDPTRNVATRSKRAAWVNLLIDEFLQFTAELRSLEPGWSQTPQCKLTESECRWLDDDGVKATDAELDRTRPTDTPERISAAFANWLNVQLRPPLPMGDPEFLAWRNTMYEEIKAQEREGTHAE